MSSSRVALFGACIAVCAAYAQAATDGGESLPMRHPRARDLARLPPPLRRFGRGDLVFPSPACFFRLAFPRRTLSVCVGIVVVVVARVASSDDILQLTAPSPFIALRLTTFCAHLPLFLSVSLPCRSSGSLLRLHGRHVRSRLLLYVPSISSARLPVFTARSPSFCSVYGPPEISKEAPKLFFIDQGARF